MGESAMTTETKTYLTDVLLKEIKTESYSLDVLLKKIETKTYLLDVLLAKPETKEYLLDLLLKEAKVKDYLIDIVLMKPETKEYLLDVLFKPKGIKEYYFDVLLMEPKIKDYLLDVLLMKAEVKDYLIDVLMREENKVKEYLIDVLTKEQDIVSTYLIDVNILETRETGVTIMGDEELLECDAIDWAESQTCNVAVRNVPLRSTGSFIDTGTYTLKNRKLDMTIRLSDLQKTTLKAIFDQTLTVTVIAVGDKGTWTYTAWLRNKPIIYEYSKHDNGIVREWIAELEFDISSFSYKSA